jgi:hypothetical protein
MIHLFAQRGCARFLPGWFPLPQVPPDPAHLATGTAAAVIRPALWLKPRCSRSLSFAPLPPVENVQNTVSLPLAVSFPVKCVFSYGLIFGVHSTRASSCKVNCLAGMPVAFTPEFFEDANKKKQWAAFSSKNWGFVAEVSLASACNKEMAGFSVPVIEALNSGTGIGKNKKWSQGSWRD